MSRDNVSKNYLEVGHDGALVLELESHHALHDGPLGHSLSLHMPFIGKRLSLKHQFKSDPFNHTFSSIGRLDGNGPGQFYGSHVISRVRTTRLVQ